MNVQYDLERIKMKNVFGTTDGAIGNILRKN